MDDIDMERQLVAYAGPDYAEPKMIRVASFRFDDYEDDDIDAFIKGLTDFRNEHLGATFVSSIRGTDWFSILVGYDAKRSESPEEIVVRVDGYKREILGRVEQSELAERKLYDRLKQKFEER